MFVVVLGANVVLSSMTTDRPPESVITSVDARSSGRQSDAGLAARISAVVFGLAVSAGATGALAQAARVIAAAAPRKTRISPSSIDAWHFHNTDATLALDGVAVAS